MKVKNYYCILGVLRDASEKEVKKAYRKKALHCHPDKAERNKITIEEANSAFKLIQEAYETLSNPEKRRNYDKIFEDESTKRVFDSCMGTQNDDQPKSKDEVRFFVEKLNKEMHSILDKDDVDILSQYLEKDYPNSFLKSVLYYACRKGRLNIVRYLIEVRKISAHSTVISGERIFFSGPVFKAAAESGNLSLVQYLLECHSVDIESQGLLAGLRDTALSRAAYQGHEDIVIYLISKGANLNPEVCHSNILRCAICSKKLSVVRLLVEAGTKIGAFDLAVALEQGVLDIVQYLLKKQPGIQTHHYALSSPACKAVSSGSVALVKYLEEEEGLNILEGEGSVWKVMKAAAESGSSEMVRFLLDDKGLNDQVFAASAWSFKWILGEALQTFERTVQFIKFLMEERKFLLSRKKLWHLIKTDGKCCPIEIISYLHSYLSNSKQERDMLLSVANQGIKGLSPSDLFRLYDYSIKITAKSHRWIEFSFKIHSHIENLQMSLEQLRELLLKDPAIMEEALFYFSSYYFKNNLLPLKLLLELGVDLNVENSKGIAAIHYALDSNLRYNDVISFYVDNGADLSKRNRWGRTAEERIRKLKELS